MGIGFHYFGAVEVASRDALLEGSLSINSLGMGERRFADDFTEFRIAVRPHYFSTASLSILEYGAVKYRLRGSLRYVAGAPANANVIFQLYPVSHLFLEAGVSTAGIMHFGFGLDLRDLPFLDEQVLRFHYGFSPSFFDNGGLFGNTHQVTFSYSY